jgi:hypothetical protein
LTASLFKLNTPSGQLSNLFCCKQLYFHNFLLLLFAPAQSSNILVIMSIWQFEKNGIR